MINFRLYLLLACCLLIGNTLQAQKAKFKGEVVKVQKTRLPLNYTEPSRRTYNLYTIGSYAAAINAHGKTIHGWTWDQESPNLKGVVSIYGFSTAKPRVTTKDRQTKDKEGNVTAKWTEYTYIGSAQGRGTLYIYGENNPFKFNAKPRKKTKAELKREAAEAAKQKELEENPFLSAEDSEGDIGEDVGLQGENLPLADQVNLNISKSVQTRAHRSSNDAYQEYTRNKQAELNNFRQVYPEAAYTKAVSVLNQKYGYTPTVYTFYLKAMKSDKHDEFKTWNEACQASQLLFGKFRASETIQASEEKFNPILAYFTGLVNKIPDTDKKEKKVKKFAFQNMMTILSYLDRHDEVIEWCTENLESKVLGSVAKRELRRAEEFKAHLAFHHMTTRHMETLTNVSDDDIETADEDDDEED